MNSAVVGLVASYVVLATLLLSLNLRSGWRWSIKATAIAITTAFFAITFIALQAMLGWPTEGSPPSRFQLHAALVNEPDRKGEDPGAIYLWVSPREEDGAVAGPPRAYALPYSRALHEATARAQAGLEAGKPIDGKLDPEGDPNGHASTSPPVQLFERALSPLPPKTG
ncbi:MAG: hypothetical protein AAF637_02360 [Pseudomonadota bacterium]